MKKVKFIFLALMLAIIVIAPGYNHANADETLVTPNQLVVFKIGDHNYYTQEIGTDKVDKVKMDAAPMISQGRTFVPVRFLGNALGVDDSNIKWDSVTSTATLQGKSKLELKIGVLAITKDGAKITIDVAPAIVPPGRTVLPARYVAEGLGFKVDWDDANKLVVCYPEGTQKPNIKAVINEIAKQVPAQPVQPVTPAKPGEKVMHSDELEAIYKVLQGKGYNVSLPTYPDTVNNYGSIAVSIDKKATNKAQYDADVCEQIESYVGSDGAKWANKILYACGSPAATNAQQGKVFGDKGIAIYLFDTQYNKTTGNIDSCEVVEVVFSDFAEFRR